MNYHFTRKRLVILMACLVILIFSTFAAGVVTGIGLVIPTRQELALLKAGKPSTTVAVAPPKVSVPILDKVPAKPEVPALPAAAVQVAEAASQPAPAAPAAPPAAPAPAQAPAQAPAPAPAQAPAAVVAEAATPEEGEAFSLQVASFRDATKAVQLQADLKAQGYAANILTALDSEQREWHVVRIDGFKTLASASRAAVNFNAKERRFQALVRRSSSL